MIPDLISQLQERLQKPLPGRHAHEKLKPILPKGSRFKDLDRSTARYGGVLLLLYQKQGEWYFPLIQRPTYDGIHSGQVAFPGGRREDADSSLIATALRESFEEVGTSTQKVKVIGSLSEFFVAASNHLVLPVVGLYPEVPKFLPDPREVDHIIEAPLSQLMDHTVLKQKEIQVASGYRLVSPYYEIENKVVWGATAMILGEFVQIIRELE